MSYSYCLPSYFPLNSILNGIDSSSLDSSSSNKESSYIPPFYIKEANDAYYLIINMAGCKTEDISLEVIDNSYLQISYKDTNEYVDEKSKMNRYKIATPEFSIFHPLAKDADPETITSLYNNGILTCKVSKITPNNKKINIVEE